jgi:hypothetical protein
MKSQSFPPAKKVADFLNIPIEKARLVRGLVKRTIYALDHPDLFPETHEWINSCYNMPSSQDMRMEAINEAMGGYGVESIGDFDIFPPRVHLEYVNTGDTYSATVVRRSNGRYVLSTWGDEYERLPQSQQACH